MLLSSARIPLWLSCLHCVGLQHFGEWEGLSEQGLGCFRFHASLVVLRVLPGVGAGSEARGEGLRCSQAAVVLAYEVQVTVSVLVCLATLRSPSVLLSFLICRGRAGPETPAFCRAAGHRAPGEASCVLVSMLGFCTKCQCFSLICYEGPAFCASLCWLAALGEGEGLSEQLAAVGSIKSGCSSCYADASERGVNPRLEVGGSACFPLALRSPGCGCFCLRLDFHVTVSVRGGQGSQPGFLVLAFSARTLKSSGVPARRVPAEGFCVSMSPLVCSTPACPGLLRGSSWVFVRSTVVARWGAAFHLAPRR